MAYRSGSLKVLGVGLTGSHGGEGTGGAAVKGERLDVDVGLAVVLDDGLLGESATGGKGGADDGSEGLHFDG